MAFFVPLEVQEIDKKERQERKERKKERKRNVAMLLFASNNC